MILKYTLLSDGSSDACLQHPINWLLGVHGWHRVRGERADLSLVPSKPKKLKERIEATIQLYPGDLLFIHRDAERAPPEERVQEIERALNAVINPPRYVCIVPVRMTEAWLLHEEQAIRKAAGRPTGAVDLELPPLEQIEKIPNPKDVLDAALIKAAAAQGRKLSKLHRDLPRIRHRVAELISDFGPLKQLQAFRAFDRLLADALQALKDRMP